MHSVKMVKTKSLLRKININSDHVSITDQINRAKGYSYWTGAPLNTAYGESARYWINKDEGFYQKQVKIDSDQFQIKVL